MIVSGKINLNNILQSYFYRQIADLVMFIIYANYDAYKILSKHTDILILAKDSALQLLI